MNLHHNYLKTRLPKARARAKRRKHIDAREFLARECGMAAGKEEGYLVGHREGARAGRQQAVAELTESLRLKQGQIPVGHQPTKLFVSVPVMKPGQPVYAAHALGIGFKSDGQNGGYLVPIEQSDSVQHVDFKYVKCCLEVKNGYLVWWHLKPVGLEAHEGLVR